jgi:hypothetical protein
MSLPTLMFVAPAGVCALAWAGAGAVVPRRWLDGGALIDALTRVAAGSVLVALGLFALGRAHLFERWAIVVLTGVLALVGVVALVRSRSWLRLPGDRDRLRTVLLAAVGLALAIDVLAATAPPTSADALKYHLALPKLWLQLGSIPDSFWSWLSFNPSSIEMLYAQGLAVGGGSTAATLHAIMLVLCACAVYGLARELAGDELAAAVATFAFVLQGIVTWEATSAFVELGLTFYVVLAVWHAVIWSRDGSFASAGWTGAMAGAAAGTKYLGLLPAALVVGVLGAAAIARRTPRQATLATIASAAVGGAWYVKNAVVAGNPVYPLLFGGRWVTPYAETAIRSVDDAYGVPHGLLRLPILPVDLLVHGAAFDRGQYVGVGIFLGAAAAVLVCRTRLLALLVAGSIVYLIAWEVQAPQARFLLPVLAVLAAVAGAGAARLLHAGGVRRVVVLAVLAATGVAWAGATVALTRQLLPVTVGLEGRRTFLERLTGTYDAFTAMRARSHGTLAVAGYPLTFSVPGPTIQVGLTEFDPAISRHEYISRLEDLGVTRLVVADTPGTRDFIAPLRSCLDEVSTYRARFVTSRASGTSTPLQLHFYSLARCRDRP